MRIIVYLLSSLLCSYVLANPYPDPRRVPKDPPFVQATEFPASLSSQESVKEAIDILRVDVSWHATKGCTGQAATDILI